MLPTHEITKHTFSAAPGNESKGTALTGLSYQIQHEIPITLSPMFVSFDRKPRLINTSSIAFTVVTKKAIFAWNNETWVKC